MIIHTLAPIITAIITVIKQVQPVRFSEFFRLPQILITDSSGALKMPEWNERNGFSEDSIALVNWLILYAPIGSRYCQSPSSRRAANVMKRQVIPHYHITAPIDHIERNGRKWMHLALIESDVRAVRWNRSEWDEEPGFLLLLLLLWLLLSYCHYSGKSWINLCLIRRNIHVIPILL